MFITEIFKSIQGEGTRAGRPCIFVRLTGCNLRCTWCDTAYAFHGGEWWTIEAVSPAPRRAPSEHCCWGRLAMDQFPRSLSEFERSFGTH